jgi:hypothetical protein
MKGMRAHIIRKINEYREEALEILPTAEFRFFWPTFNVLREFVEILELPPLVLNIGTKIIHGLVMTEHNKQSYYIPGIVAAVINQCADYMGVFIPRSSLKEFMEISIKTIRDEGMKLEDMNEIEEIKFVPG